MIMLPQNRIKGIDSLRALAIVGVLFFHLFPKFVPGGFLGVDIFFVLSGFLIALVLDKESINIRTIFNFIIRRVRRLFPALWLTLILTLSAGYFLLLDNEFKKLLTESLSAALFYFNITQIDKSGYFDPGVLDEEAILNLWTLSVEFQFYLLFPLIYLVTNSKKNRLTLCAICGFVAFIFTQNLDPEHYNWLFYHPFSRCWEFLAGSSCYLIYQCYVEQIKVPNDKIIVAWASKFASIGIVLLILLLISCFFWLDSKTDQPSIMTLIPVICTCLLILAFYSLNIWHRFMMPIEFLGRISYPLYLAHWPAHYLLSKLNLNIALINFGTITISFCFSILCYFILDKWTRSWSAAMTVFFSIVTITPLILASQSSLSDRLKPRLTELPLLWSRVYEGHPGWGSARSWDTILEANHPFIVPVSKDVDPFQDFTSTQHAEILIIGDSHAELIWPRLLYLRKKQLLPGQRIAFLTAAGCAPISNFRMPEQKCDAFFSQVKKYIKRTKPKKIILHAYWDRYLIGSFDDLNKKPKDNFHLRDFKNMNNSEDASHLERAIISIEKDLKFYSSLGAKVYLIDAVPASQRFDKNFMLTFLNRLSPQKELPETITKFSKAAWLDFYQPVKDKFLALEQKSLLTYIDPVNYICLDEMCPTMKNGNPIYTNADHIGSFYVMKNGMWIDQIFELR